MSREAFANAEVGARAHRKSDNAIAEKTTQPGFPWRIQWPDFSWDYANDNWMSANGFTLGGDEDDVVVRDYSPAELAQMLWDAGKEIKAGQTWPEGLRGVTRRSNGSIMTFTANNTFIVKEGDVGNTRSFVPLTDETPDWYELPAVLAWSSHDSAKEMRVWVKSSDGMYESRGDVVHWAELCDVKGLEVQG